jgi:GTPase SAR1 family protein
MMRIPLRKEAQHFQIMGDTGVGKTQLIMQILRQIRERGDSAVVYDPACEYLFFPLCASYHLIPLDINNIAPQFTIAVSLRPAFPPRRTSCHR